MKAVVQLQALITVLEGGRGIAYINIACVRSEQCYCHRYCYQYLVEAVIELQVQVLLTMLGVGCYAWVVVQVLLLMLHVGSGTVTGIATYVTCRKWYCYLY